MADKTKSYKKLITNTITFAIGSFGSKILVLLLVPLYTAALSPEQFGTADLIAQTANLLIPLFTFTIAEAALRFGLDAKIREDRAKVYSNCLSVLLCGVLLMVAVLPLWEVAVMVTVPAFTPFKMPFAFTLAYFLLLLLKV